jgi:hypothetical protein
MIDFCSDPSSTSIVRRYCLCIMLTTALKQSDESPEMFHHGLFVSISALGLGGDSL